jgi:transposase
MREACLAMLDQIAVLDRWIDAKTVRIKEITAATPVSKRLQTIPGFGPLVAMAVGADPRIAIRASASQSAAIRA